MNKKLIQEIKDTYPQHPSNYECYVPILTKEVQRLTKIIEQILEIHNNFPTDSSADFMAYIAAKGLKESEDA